MKTNRKIIIAAGGTGGHLYPGLALAQELRQRGYEPEFVLRKGDAGREILERGNFVFYEIPSSGLPRSFSVKIFKFIFFLIKGIIAASKILKQTNPKVVLGMGGYVSFPVVILARLKGIPAIIHEQNAIPGLSNRLLFPFVNKVAISFEDSLKRFPKEKTVVTGNPLRKELFEIKLEDAYKYFDISSERFTILVFGGSQGASKINKTVIDSLPLLSAIRDRIQFIHLTGAKDLPAVSKGYQSNRFLGRIFQYLHNMGQAYAVSDLIICRAGATTIAELSLLNKRAILIPFPFAAANHQEFNAALLVKSGNAVLINERELSAKILAEAICSDLNTFKKHSLNFNPPDRLPQQVLADLVEIM